MSTHLRASGLLLVLFALCVPASVMAAPADEGTAGATDKPLVEARPPGHHFELGGYLAGTLILEPLAVDAGVDSDRIVGFGGALMLAYRAPFFLFPFIDVGYYDLASSTINAIAATGNLDDRVENHLDIWTFTVGPAVDIGWLRIRYGWGFYTLGVSSKGPGFDDDVAAHGFLNSLMLSAFILQKPSYRIGIEARGARTSFAGMTFFTLGVSGSGDFLSW